MELRLGALFVQCEPIPKQLKKQGLRAKDKKDGEMWQKDAEAICRLHIRGLMNDSEVVRSRGKLVKAIADGVVAIKKRNH